MKKAMRMVGIVMLVALGGMMPQGAGAAQYGFVRLDPDSTGLWSIATVRDGSGQVLNFIGGYHGPGGDVVIPEKVRYFDGYLMKYISTDDLSGIWDSAFVNRLDITGVTISNTVHYIGEGAFAGCQNLSRLAISGSVTTIDQAAFAFCHGLKDLTFPPQVTSIGQWAFYNCMGLERVTMGEGMISIGTLAFAECHNLERVVISAGVTNITYGAFAQCTALKSVHSLGSFPPTLWSNTSYPNVFGGVNMSRCTLYLRAGAKAAYQAADWWKLFTNIEEEGEKGYIIDFDGVISEYTGNGGEVAIPDTIWGIQPTVIGAEVFYRNAALTTVTIPASVDSIGDMAFDQCSSLTAVTFAEGSQLRSIGENAFVSCSLLASINFPEGLTTIGDAAFAYCSRLTSVNLPSSLRIIEDAAFRLCERLSSLTLPEGLQSIGYTAFAHCYALSSLTIPASVTAIKYFAFGYCPLTEMHLRSSTPPTLGEGVDDGVWYGVFPGVSGRCPVYVPNGAVATYQQAAQWRNFDNIVVEGTPRVEVFFRMSGNELTHYSGLGGNDTVPPTVSGVAVTSIGRQAFAADTLLTGITLSAGVTSIGAQAFDSCTNLTTAALPASISTIAEQAFNNCRSLTAITFADASSLQSLGEYAFRGCRRMKSFAFPSSVKTTGYGLFNDCDSLASVTLSVELANVGGAQFTGCTQLTALHARNPIPASPSAGAFDAVANTCTLYVPGGMKALYQNAALWNFASIADEWASTAADFTVSGGALTAYRGSTNGAINIPNAIDNQPITTVNGNLFANKDDLTVISLPAGVQTLGSNAFANCPHLTTIFAAENGLEAIADHAFYNCPWLRSIVPHTAMNTANVLADVNIPRTVTAIWNWAFGLCSNIEVVKPNANSELQIIADNAFYQCASLRSVILPDGVTGIGAQAFCWCPSLETIVLSSRTYELGAQAFYRCTGLDTLVCRSITPPRLGADAFGGGVPFANAALYVPQTSGAAYRNVDTWRNFVHLTPDIPVGHDTVYTDTVYTEYHKDTTIYDITRRDTTIVDTTLADTTIYTYDTTRRDTTITDTLYTIDTIYIYTDTFYTIDTIYTDTTVIRDTAYVDTTLYDTTLIKLYDTTRVDTTLYDTTLIIIEITDSTLVPETLFVHDTIVEWQELPVYIVVDPNTAAQTIVTDEARIVDSPTGVMLEGLTPGELYAVYTTDGHLIIRANAPSVGVAFLPDLEPGAYILYHNHRWSKFAH